MFDPHFEFSHSFWKINSQFTALVESAGAQSCMPPWFLGSSRQHKAAGDDGMPI